jgi:Heme/copper-type cytochrome/quinol oxidases, subunit 1
MTCKYILNPHNIHSSLLTCTRICILIYNRRSYRCSTRKLINQHCTAWHLLYSSTFPLCPINRKSVCNQRRIHPTIPTNHRTYYNPKWLKTQFAIIFAGVNITFFPQHFLGLPRIPQRYSDYPDAYTTWNIISSIEWKISFLWIIIFLFITWERITSNWQILFPPKQEIQ